MGVTLDYGIEWWEEDEGAADAWADHFAEGYLARSKGLTRPTHPVQAEGWDQSNYDAKRIVIMPSRPEGYYHLPIGSFD